MTCKICGIVETDGSDAINNPYIKIVLGTGKKITVLDEEDNGELRVRYFQCLMMECRIRRKSFIVRYAYIE